LSSASRFFFFFFARRLGGDSLIRYRMTSMISDGDVRGKEKMRGCCRRDRTGLDAFSAKNESVFGQAVWTRVPTTSLPSEFLLRHCPQSSSSSCESVQESRRGLTVLLIMIIVASVCLSFGSPFQNESSRSPTRSRRPSCNSSREKTFRFSLFRQRYTFFSGPLLCLWR
jgi:hypothetical protein